MRSKAFLAALTIATALAIPSTKAADNALELTFSRNGTTASSVTVNTSGVDGATATLVSASHSFRGTSGSTTSSIICPNVNGNTSPTITLEFSITGLTESFSITSIDFNIHALNGSDGYQDHNDNKKRLYNLSAHINGSPFGSLTEFDIADGVNPTGTSRNKLWNIQPATSLSATNPLTLRLTISAGSANEGCFFGLSSIRFNTGSETPGPDPDPDPTPQGDYYLIKWKANTSDYMQQSGDKFIVGDYSVSTSCFWELIPTDNTNCYYIRNVATGQYIGSCNNTPSSSSKIYASNTPVEYYAGQTSGTAAEISGCVWLSSTDCTGYSSESGARALNKDGASSDIITWQNGTSRVGSYWTLVKTENLYELRPFIPASVIGQATDFYYIQNTAGKALTTDLTWTDRASDENQRWYFQGTSAASGGYQIVAAATDTPVFNGTRYVPTASSTSGYYNMTDADGNLLTIDGETEFSFATFRVRSKFALDAQIYTLPCGSSGDYYVTNLTVSTPDHLGDLHYPMATKSGSGIVYPAATRPTNRYTMLSRDHATITDDTFDVAITLNASPSENTRVFLYFDWNRDGDFETAYELPASANMQTEVEVPKNLAKEGMSRMRVRITDNGLVEADDDINGQVLDLFIKYADTEGSLFDPTVSANAANRGTATYDPATNIATATSIGTATFLYWAENFRIHSLESTCEIAPASVPRKFIAMFSPNLDETVGIDNVMLTTADSHASIYNDGREITVVAESQVKHILVFALDGALVSHAVNTTSLSADSLTSGIYIVKAVTSAGTATAKIILN